MAYRYQRILLKLSGEAVFHSSTSPSEAAMELVRKIGELAASGLQIGIVIGGGNIMRGVQAQTQGMDRVESDQMGMLATVINGIALKGAFDRAGVPVALLSAIGIPRVVEEFTKAKAVNHLEQGKIVVFCAGTGNPYFSTDTAAALRAAEIGAQCLLKATKVDGVYDDDPIENPAAKRYDRLTYSQALQDNLKVMDAASISLCRDNGIPIMVFKLDPPENLAKAVTRENFGTVIDGDNFSRE